MLHRQIIGSNASVITNQQVRMLDDTAVITRWSVNRQDKNKGYSLHEPDVYCVGKRKDHKPYEYGRKASVVATRE